MLSSPILIVPEGILYKYRVYFPIYRFIMKGPLKTNIL